MTLRSAKTSSEMSRSDPTRHRPNCSRTHTNDIHVIVFRPLFCREVVVNNSSSYTRKFVGTHRCPDTAARDGDTSVNLGRN